MRRLFVAPLLVAVAGMGAGCGQKGPLRLPASLVAPAASTDTPAAATPAPASPSASAASAPR